MSVLECSLCDCVNVHLVWAAAGFVWIGISKPNCLFRLENRCRMKVISKDLVALVTF